MTVTSLSGGIDGEAPPPSARPGTATAVAPAAGRRRATSRRMLKRILDLLVAGLALVILSPLLLVLLISVWLTLGDPPIFGQFRPGRNGLPFRLLKFRTMRTIVGPDGEAAPDDVRLVPFGRWLRASSLDELPELVNILKGDMSLVGPRPLLMEYLALYSPEQTRRHGVRPGLTGWAQINGRNATTWAERLALDVWYVDHASLWLDLQILGRTVLTVIRREGISQPGQATMEKFKGNPE